MYTFKVDVFSLVYSLANNTVWLTLIAGMEYGMEWLNGIWNGTVEWNMEWTGINHATDILLSLG